MKTTRTIAGVALASLLVIGPLTMTSAHEFPWPGPLKGTLPGAGPALAGAGEDSVLQVDLRVSGLSAAAIGQLAGSTSDDRGFVVTTLIGRPDCIVLTIPGSSESALIQIDVTGRPALVATLHRFFDGVTGGVIVCPIAPERETVVVTAWAYEAGMDPQTATQASFAGALLYATGSQL